MRRRRTTTTHAPSEDTTIPKGTVATLLATVRGWFARSTEDLTDSQVLDLLLDQVHELRCQVAELAATMALTSSSVDAIELSMGDLATAGTRD